MTRQDSRDFLNFITYYYKDIILTNSIIARKSILPQCIIIVEPQCPWRVCNLRDRAVINWYNRLF